MMKSRRQELICDGNESKGVRTALFNNDMCLDEIEERTEERVDRRWDLIGHNIFEVEEIVTNVLLLHYVDWR